MLSVDASELPLTAALAAVVLAAFALLYRPIVLVSFDRRRAAAMGLPVERVEFATMLLLAVAVVVGFRVVGALLVLGLLIAPPAAAAMVTRRLPSMIAVSAGDRCDQRPDRAARLLASRRRRRLLDRAHRGRDLARPDRSPAPRPARLTADTGIRIVSSP